MIIGRLANYLPARLCCKSAPKKLAYVILRAAEESQFLVNQNGVRAVAYSE